MATGPRTTPGPAAGPAAGRATDSAVGSAAAPVPRQAAASARTRAQAQAQAQARPVDRRPVRRMTVLYDQGCRLCGFAAGWLARQRQLVPLDLVPAGSDEARRRFPALDHAATAEDITVVGDGGQVYRGDSAWVVCLWALADHRAFSHTLTTPAGRRLARAAVLSAAKYRSASKRPAAPAAWSTSPGPADTRTYGMAPGWTYHPATGWTAAEGDACADGCGRRPG